MKKKVKKSKKIVKKSKKKKLTKKELLKLKNKKPGMFISEDDMKEKSRLEDELNSEASSSKAHYEDVKDKDFHYDDIDIMEEDMEESSSSSIEESEEMIDNDIEECPECGDDPKVCGCKENKKEEEE